MILERKVVSISSKRQITIPQKYYSMLGFSDEAEISLRGDELVLRPARSVSDGAFDEQILKELIDDGFSGEELLRQFRIKRAKIRPAVEAMISEAENVAQGKGKYAGYEDIFGTEE